MRIVEEVESLSIFATLRERFLMSAISDIVRNGKAQLSAIFSLLTGYAISYRKMTKDYLAIILDGHNFGQL